MNEQRQGIFERALAAALELQTRYPDSRPLSSAIEQLTYLLAVTRNEQPADMSKIATINIGIIAAKEVEDMDEQVAELLHQAAAQAREMTKAG